MLDPLLLALESQPHREQQVSAQHAQAAAHLFLHLFQPETFAQ
jgi:hypothetical protein